MKVLVRIVRREKNRDAGALANVRMMLLCPEAPSPRALLPVHSNADEIITHPFDVAGLVFDLVVDGGRPLVIDPPKAGSSGKTDHFADQVFAVLILQVE